MASQVPKVVTQIAWARRKGRGWIADVYFNDANKDRTNRPERVWLPTLSNKFVWQMTGNVVTGVQHNIPSVDDSNKKKKKQLNPLNGSAGGGLELACSSIDLDPDNLMSMFDNATSCEWGWHRVDGMKGMRWHSARRVHSPPTWPEVGGYFYAPHWEPQVQRVRELLPANTLVRHAEPIQGEPTPPLVTPCPMTHAELTSFGIDVTLVFPDQPTSSSRPSRVVVVGLEDTTLTNLIYLLEWLGSPEIQLEVWHRWPVRDDIPWRGEHSPPMALEVVTAFGTRGEPGQLLGEPETLAARTIKSVRRMALHQGLPWFTIGNQMPSCTEVGSTVYDSKLGLFMIVKNITPGRKPSGRTRSGRKVQAGLVYGGGCMMLELQCGAVQRVVHSDLPWLSDVTEQPEKRLPRLGMRVQRSSCESSTN